MPRVGVVGRGVVGDRIARRLPTVVRGVEVIQLDPRAARHPPVDLDVVVLAHGGAHAASASAFAEAGVAVVSVSDDLGDVRALADLDLLAVGNGVPLVVGAGMAPGLTGLLARLLASELASCDEIHIALHGTAGPSCARQQHRALRGLAVGFHDGSWIQRPAGSGRELCYFPEPVGPYDCYRAELSSPVLSPPHREGGVGAVRVEVRGSDESGGRCTLIAGAAELVGTATAATAIAFASAAVEGRLEPGVVRAGDPSLDTVALLRTVSAVGVRLQEFTGVLSELRIRANP